MIYSQKQDIHNITYLINLKRSKISMISQSQFSKYILLSRRVSCYNKFTEFLFDALDTKYNLENISIHLFIKSQKYIPLLNQKKKIDYMSNKNLEKSIPSTNVYDNLSLLDGLRITKLTRGTMNTLKKIKPQSQSNQPNPLDKVKKKLKKNNEEPILKLCSINFLTNQQENQIHNKSINRIQKNFLPTFIKVIEPYVRIIMVQNTYLFTHKKNINKQWIKQCLGGELRRKVSELSKILGMQQICFQQLSFQQFNWTFADKIKQFTLIEKKSIFGTYKLPEQDKIIWPAMILQPLNFNHISEIIDIVNNQVRDDRSKLPFLPIQNCQQMEIDETFQNFEMKPINIDEDLLIWYIGTNVYKIVKQSSLIHFNQLPKQILQRNFQDTCFRVIQDDCKQFLENFNNKIQKNNEVQFKAEDKKIFLRRVIKSKENPNDLFIILRFKQSKQSKAILVRNLKTSQIFWTDLEPFRICYNLPQLNEDELLYLYLSQKLDQNLLLRQKIILELLFSNFFHHQINQQEYFKKYYSHKIYEEKPRCTQCYYILHTFPCLQCFFCKKTYHKQCVPQEDAKPFSLGQSNQYWCCKKCEPCKVCFSYIQSDRITCYQCKRSFHKQCGKTRQSTEFKYKFECEQCLKCDLCGRKSKQCTDGYVFVQNNIYCNDCKLISNGQYCNICKKSWKSQFKQAKAEWVQCTCNDWVHKSCDEMLKSNYKKFQEENAQYNCPHCRNIIKRRYLKQIIEVLMKFDQFAYFLQPTYDTFTDYRQIISNPMCFKKMIEKCTEGLYDYNGKKNLTDDFNLIIDNAQLYNMPKDHSHYCARILKIMGDLTLEYLDSIFFIDDLELIQNKTISNMIQQKERELYRYLYEHYLEIILNKNSTKSKISIKLKNALPPLPEQLFFKSRHILNNFKNSQISIIYKKQSPKIQHLFSLPKSLVATKLSITQPTCYYHNDKNIITTCQICFQSYCCVKKCFLHQKCQFCSQMGCRCYLWDCGCKPGYNPKDLDHPNLKPYITNTSELNNILEITGMFEFCLKCSIDNIKMRQCKYCKKVCSSSYEYCVNNECLERYHKSCRKKYYIPNLCAQCQNLPQYENKFKEMLKQDAKKKIYKLVRADKYLPVMLNIFLQQNINLDAYQIKQMIFENYDRIEQYSQEIENYITYNQKISLNKIKEQKIRMSEMTMKQNIQLLKSPLTDTEKIFCSQHYFLKQTISNNIELNMKYQKLFQKYRYIPRKQFFLQRLNVLISQYHTRILITNNFMEHNQSMQIEQQEKSSCGNYRIFIQINQIQIIRGILENNKIKHNFLCENYLLSASLVFTLPGSYIVENTYKQLSDLHKIVKNLFISFYNEYKLYPRVGSTCLIDLKEYDITVYKKWSKEKGITIRLSKQKKIWKIQINKVQKVISTFQQLLQSLSKIKKFDTLQEVGAFLGLNISFKKEIQYSYIKFLQTNLLDNDSFNDRKKKVLFFYDKVKHNIPKKKELFFLKRNSKESESNYENVNPPYITFEQLKKQIQDQPIIEKINLKITEPNQQIFIAPSTIHKLGLFAKKFLPKHTILIQYIGEILSQPIADVRQSQFHLGCYMFGIPKKQQEYLKLNQDTIDQYTPHIHSKKDIIDATFRGNQARYLNHSCDPNCASKIEQDNGRHRILIYSIRDIQAFQELTYDYQFKVSADEKIVCTCGAKNCQGRLN